MLLSVVIPVYRGEASIAPLVSRLLAEVTDSPLEIVLVNDGSPDNSHAVCTTLAGEHPEQVVYLELARNFGEHNAVMAGLNHCRGDYAVIMDDDFQNPPEEVLRLVAAAQRENWDVVYSRYEEKQHHWFRNLGSRFNGWMASLVIGKPRELYLSSFKCLNRFMIDQVTTYRGPFPYLDGLILRSTDKIGTELCRHDARQDGESNYTLRRLVRLWLNMFVGFSVMPLRLSFLAGFVLSIFAAIMIVLVVVEKILYPDVPTGWSSLASIVMFFSAIQLFILGLIGEYLGRTLLTGSNQPQFVLRSSSRQGSDGKQS